MSSTTPAGWYDDGSGRQRWWDGEQWTDRFAEAKSSSDTEAEPDAEAYESNGRFKNMATGLLKKGASQVKAAAVNQRAQQRSARADLNDQVKDSITSAGKGVRDLLTGQEAPHASAPNDGAEPLFTTMSHIQGKNARVRLWPDRLEWERGRGISLLSPTLRGGKDAYEMLPLSQITSVANRKDGLLYHLVEVQTAGGTVGFRVTREVAGEFRQAILDQLFAKSSAPVVVQAAAPTAASAPDAADQIAKLADLHKQGILTDDEFAAAKAKALGL